MSIALFFSSHVTKKRLSTLTLIVFIGNIFSPILSYAALPSFSSVLTVANTVPVAEVVELTLPRDLVSGDALSVTVNGSTVMQSFVTSSTLTAQLLNLQIGAISGISSVYDTVAKKFTVSSAVAGTAITVGNLTIVRSPIVPNTVVNNVVAVAQQSEVTISQTLFVGDVIQCTIWGVAITQAFDTDTDTTLSLLAGQITTLTSADATYDTITKKVSMSAKIAGTAFSLSNFVTTSGGISVAVITPNVVPVAQVNTIDIPRAIYADETLHITIDGTTINQEFNTDYTTTLAGLTAQIDALATVDAGVVGSQITITATVPGTPFVIGNLTITGGTINSAHVVANREAVAQIDAIVFPRDLVPGDTIDTMINGTPIQQAYTVSSDATLTALSNAINLLPNLSSFVNFGLRAIVISSTVPGTPFTVGGTDVSTAVNSTLATASVVAQTQSESITFLRAFRSGDNISLVINGSTITQVWDTDTDTTLNALNTQIDSMSAISAVADTVAKKITITSDTAGVAFNVSDTTIVNNIAPTVLVASVTPVSQSDVFSMPHTILAGDTIALTVDGTPLTQAWNADESTTLSALNTQIDGLAGVTSALDGGTKTYTVTAATAGTPFTISTVTTTGAPFVATPVTPNTPETKASLALTVAAVPVDTESIVVGTCTINFINAGGVDTDCSNGNATIDIAGVTSVQTIAALLRGITGVSDANNGVLTIGWSGDQVTYTTANSQTSALDIGFTDNTSGDITAVLTSPVVPVSQVSTFALPRNFVSGDTFTVVVNGITVTQNFTSDNDTSLAALDAQLEALPNIASSLAGNVITLTAETAGTAFVTGNAQFINIQTPSVTVSNTVGVAEKKSITFPVALVAGDVVNITIDGTPVSEAFNTDSPTTLAALVAAINAAVPAVTATLPTPLNLVIEANAPGVTFSIDHMDVTNTTAAVNVTPNVVWVAQVSTLTVSFIPVAGDTLVVDINGTLLTQAFTTDVTTTLSLLNTQIDALAQVSSSVDIGTSTFTITAAVTGVPFTASLSATAATINSVNTTPNTTALAQVDTITVDRIITSSDTLTLDIDGTTLTQTWNTDTTTTLTDLNAQIDALASVSSSFDVGTSTFTITAATPGTPFVSGILTINNTTSSINTIANVVAVAQIDQISLLRAPLAGDTISVVIDGTTIDQTFDTDATTTLDALKAQVDASAVTMTYVGNVITLTADVAWAPFTVGSITVSNSLSPSTTVANVAPVKQETEYTFPTLVTGDSIAFSINGIPLVENFVTDENTTINNLMTQISGLSLVDPTFNAGILNMRSQVAGTPFVLSNATITNTVVPVIIVANVPAVAQVVDMTPGGPIIAGLTYRATIDGQDYDYLTQSGDTADIIIDNLAGLMATNTGIIVSTGATLQVTAAVAGTAFTYDSVVLDITPPVPSTPINAPETLQSGNVSTSTVQSNEDGEIYLVLTGTTANTVGDLASAVAAHTAFLGQAAAIADVPYTITVAAGVQDGLYNVVAVDGYTNVSAAFPGWLTVDNTAPTVVISTAPQTVNTSTITITGSTEPNLPIDITGGNGVASGVALGDGTFSIVVTLNTDASNTLTVSATDGPGNVGSDTVVIVQDSTAPSVAISTLSQTVSTPSIVIDGITEIGSTLVVTDGIGTVVGTGLALTGAFSIDSTLTLNTVNVLTVTATDLAGNTGSSSVSITQDSTPNTLVISTLPQTLNADNITLTGSTKPNSTLDITGGATTATGTADGTGLYSIVVSLTQDASNTLLVTSTDIVANVSTGSILVVEDSTAPVTTISTPAQTTQNTTITLTGTTEAFASLVITGGSGTVGPVVASASGDYLAIIPLTLNAANTLIVTATDLAGNTGSASVVITHNTPVPLPVVVVSSGWGGWGGGGLRMDSCPEGDYSPSYYDGLCGTKPSSTTTSTGTVSGTDVGTNKQNVTFTSEVGRLFPMNEAVSQEKIDAFVQSVQTRVFARTMDNASRVVTFSAMTRYLTTQIDAAKNENRKTVYTMLKNKFNSIIVTLRQNIRNGVVVIPNKKKNNASNHMTILSTTADARMYRYVNTENLLAVRWEPNFVSDTVGYLLMDQRVEVIGFGLNWSHIKAGTIDGYVRTRLLRKTMEVQDISTQLTYRAIIQKEENEEG